MCARPRIINLLFFHLPGEDDVSATSSSDPDRDSLPDDYFDHSDLEDHVFSDAPPSDVEFESEERKLEHRKEVREYCKRHELNAYTTWFCLSLRHVVFWYENVDFFWGGQKLLS